MASGSSWPIDADERRDWLLRAAISVLGSIGSITIPRSTFLEHRHQVTEPGALELSIDPRTGDATIRVVPASERLR